VGAGRVSISIGDSRLLASVTVRISIDERIITNVRIEIPALRIVRGLIASVIRRHEPAQVRTVVPGTEVVVS
jgi:hypothetical protein